MLWIMEDVVHRALLHHQPEIHHRHEVRHLRDDAEVVGDENDGRVALLLQPAQKAQVLRLLRRLQEERNSAIIFITHDLGVIAQMADFVTVMYLGLVMEQGSVDDIFHNPKHPYTKALLESIPSIHTTPRVDLPTISGSIPHPFTRPAGCPFHPRCTKFMPGKCDQHTPALLPAGENQKVSCFLYHDVEVTA